MLDIFLSISMMECFVSLCDNESFFFLFFFIILCVISAHWCIVMTFRVKTSLKVNCIFILLYHKRKVEINFYFCIYQWINLILWQKHTYSNVSNSFVLVRRINVAEVLTYMSAILHFMLLSSSNLYDIFFRVRGFCTRHKMFMVKKNIFPLSLF